MNVPHLSKSCTRWLEEYMSLANRQLIEEYLEERQEMWDTCGELLETIEQQNMEIINLKEHIKVLTNGL